MARPKPELRSRRIGTPSWHKRETAGPSTLLRSGWDDNFVMPLTADSEGSHSHLMNCHPDRSVAEWRDLRFFNQASAKRRARQQALRQSRLLPSGGWPFLDETWGWFG